MDINCSVFVVMERNQRSTKTNDSIFSNDNGSHDRYLLFGCDSPSYGNKLLKGGFASASRLSWPVDQSKLDNK